MGLDAIFKVRTPKPYMHQSLARKLVRVRTRNEAKVIAEARARGVRAPALYAAFPYLGIIVMEYVEGDLLREVIARGSEAWKDLVFTAGVELGKLHVSGIVHGDPTTSNYVVSPRGEVVLIDYGLSSFTSEVEERAVDLHLFRRALESTHASIAAAAFKEFVAGYESVMGEEASPIVKRASEIYLRGRYVEARRKSVWARMEVV